MPPLTIDVKPGSVFNRWKVGSELGRGGFGAVFNCGKDNTQHAAIKIELRNVKHQIDLSSTQPRQKHTNKDKVRRHPEILCMDVRVLLENMRSSTPSRHLCRLYDYGQTPLYNYLVMQRVGESLSALRKQTGTRVQGRTFLPLSTSLRVCRDGLCALRDLHSLSYVHRDVKPNNFAIGVGVANRNRLYLIDFGLARRFRESNGQWRARRQRMHGFKGTKVYASLRQHALIELGPRDDMEMWLYMLIDLTHGTLPWRHIDNTHDVGKAKEDVRYRVRAREALLQGCPQGYGLLLDTVLDMKADQLPPYDKMIEQVNCILKQENISEDEPYEWMLPQHKHTQHTNKTSKHTYNKEQPSK